MAEYPLFDLKIENIYGYNNTYARDNIRSDNKGRLIYSTGNQIAIYDQFSKKQLFTHHKAKVLCFEVIDNLCISAEMSEVNNILIWDLDTLEVKNKILNFFEFGVSKLSVSSDGKLIAATGKRDHQYYSIIVFNKESLINFIKTGKKQDKILMMESI